MENGDDGIVAKFKDAPAPILYGFIAVGLGMFFSDVWLNESAVEHFVIGGVGLFLAICSWSTLRRRGRPSGPV